MASFRAEDISLLGYGEFRMTSQMQQQVQQSPGSRLYGYSDYREYIMVFQYGGRCFAGGVTVVENERGWQISTLSAPAAGMPQNRLLHLSDLDGMDLEQAAEALQETYEDEYIITVLDQAAGAERRDTI